MSDTTTNVTPIREFDDDAALAFIAGQPGGRTTLRPAELARRFGWNRQRTSRRLEAWERSGQITRRGRTITVVAGADKSGLSARTNDGQAVDGTAQNPDSVRTDKSRSVTASVTPARRSVSGRAVTDVRCGVTPAPPTVDAIYATVVEEPPEPEGERPGIDGMTIIGIGVAGLLVTFSATLSTIGFMTLLPGMPQLAIAVGVAIEVTRLGVIGYTARCWGEVAPGLRLLLVMMILVAEAISFTAVYGELQEMHAGTRPVESANLAADRAVIAAKIESQKAAIADIDVRITTLDHATTALVDGAGKRGKVVGGMDVVTTNAKQRAALSDQRRVAGDALARYQADAAAVTARGEVADAALGPIREIVASLGGFLPDSVAMRVWAALIATVLGPAAAVLTAAEGSRRRRR